LGQFVDACAPILWESRGATTDGTGIDCQSVGGSVDPNGEVETPVRATANGSAANIQFDDEESVLTTFASVIALPVEGPNCSIDVVDVIQSADALENTVSHGYKFSDDGSCGLAGTGGRQSAGDRR
jgi:hypothetical protein